MRFAKPTAIVGTALCAVLPFVSAAATPPVVAQLPSLQPGTLESPLTSISWDNANHIRVYYIDATGFVQEYGYDYGNWFGPNDIGGRAKPGSDITATNLGTSGANIRIYFINTDGKLQEYVWQGGWSKGKVF